MKILLISKVPPHLDQLRPESLDFPKGQTQTYWLHALRALGHQVKVFRYSDSLLFPNRARIKLSVYIQQKFPRIWNKYRQALNKFFFFNPENYLRSQKLYRMIRDFKPHVLIFSGGISELLAWPLELAKAKGIPQVLLHGEDPLESATYFERRHLHLFDWIITNDAIHQSHWQTLGAKRVTALPYAGIDPQIHHRLHIKQSLDVVFVGTLFPDRQRILKKLTNLNFSLAIYGQILPHIGLDPKLRPIYQGEAWGKQAVRIYQSSKIVLNFVPPHMKVGGNLRTFEIPGSHAFQLANRCPTAYFVPDQEIALFSNLQDLKTKINYYLHHPQKREAIINASYRKAHRHYTYKHRFAYILKHL